MAVHARLNLDPAVTAPAQLLRPRAQREAHSLDLVSAEGELEGRPVLDLLEADRLDRVLENVDELGLLHVQVGGAGALA